VRYAAVLPLLVYGLLLAFDAISRSDGNVAVLVLVEAVAVFLSIQGLARRYTRR
jgi:hypothetical protein